MHQPRFSIVPALGAAMLGCAASSASAQDTDEDDDDAAEPACPYGYYDTSPYDCAPYGYYGPEWFDNGEFIGTGPWFGGHRDFRGHVDNRFDVRRGYRGPLPERGDQPFDHFRGNEIRDGRGNFGAADRMGGGRIGGGGRR